MPILSLIIFTPILGALLIGLLPAQPMQIARRAAFAFSLTAIWASCSLPRARRSESAARSRNSCAC